MSAPIFRCKSLGENSKTSSKDNPCFISRLSRPTVLNAPLAISVLSEKLVSIPAGKKFSFDPIQSATEINPAIHQKIGLASSICNEGSLELPKNLSITSTRLLSHSSSFLKPSGGRNPG